MGKRRASSDNMKMFIEATNENTIKTPLTVQYLFNKKTIWGSNYVKNYYEVNIDSLEELLAVHDFAKENCDPHHFQGIILREGTDGEFYIEIYSDYRE